MIFDTLCWMIEKYAPNYLARVQQSHLFYFPARPHDVLPKEIDPAIQDFLQENFFLPFPTMVIEDLASCVVLWDEVPNQRGLNNITRYFIECTPMKTDLENYREGQNPQAVEYYKSRLSLIDETSAVMTFGIIDHICGEVNGNETSCRKYHIEGAVKQSICGTKDRLFFSGALQEICRNDSDMLTATTAATLRNATTAIEEVMYFNNPSRLILEKSPLKLKHKNSSGKVKKITRSFERAIYTLVTPYEARKTMGIAEEGDSSVSPHERRSHYRTYKHEKFTNMKGKTIVIPATWVGPKEVAVGKHKYKIILD